MANNLNQKTENINQNEQTAIRSNDPHLKYEPDQINQKQQEINKQLASIEFKIHETDRDLTTIKSEIYRQEKQRESHVEEIYEIDQQISFLKNNEVQGYTNHLDKLIKNREKTQEELHQLNSLILNLKNNKENIEKKDFALKSEHQKLQKELLQLLDTHAHLAQQAYISIKQAALREERQLQEIKTKLDQAQIELKNTLDHEESLRLNFTKRNLDLQDREKRLSEQERTVSEHLAKQRQEFDDLKAEELATIKNTQEQINKTKTQLELDRERLTQEFQDRLEKTSANYINETLKGLKLTHKNLIDSADTWRALGAIALLVGFCILLYASYRANPFDPSLSWLNISYISLRGSALLLLVGAFTTYAAKTSASRSEEAKIIADRMHAIDYGAFFLNTYGTNASWEQIDSAFRHWHGNDNEKKGY